MYTVKRFLRNETIDETFFDVSGVIKSFGLRASDTCYVIMKDGKPVYTKNRLNGKMELESYARKSTAELVAKHYNEKENDQ